MQAKWKYFASNGHVKWSRIESLKLIHGYLNRLLWLVIFLAGLSFYVAKVTSQKTGDLSGWIAGAAHKVFATKLPKTELAPIVMLPMSMLPMPGQVVLTPLAAVEGEMRRLQDGFNGAAPEGCLTDKKITEPWFSSSEALPRCRIGADKNRLWVWAIVSDQIGYAKNYTGLIVREDGKNTLYNIQMPNSIGVTGVEAIEPQLIPRTMAKDFPELQGVSR